MILLIWAAQSCTLPASVKQQFTAFELALDGITMAFGKLLELMASISEGCGHISGTNGT